MIVFPMAGVSRRFSEKGYDVPKFMLPLWGGTVFDHAVSSFAAEFKDMSFMFIYRETGSIRDFVDARAKALGISKFVLCELDQPTAGQAETVELGLEQAKLPPNESLTVFNIDTFRRPGTKSAGVRSDVAGWLEVFRGSGENWSFVQPENENGLAARTAEKVAISDLCCTGLYHFASPLLFLQALEQERANPSAAELYIAPIYNHLIDRGLHIGYGTIQTEDVVFCGVPAEYESLANTENPFQYKNSQE